MSKKIATSKSGTTYTTTGDSKFYWENYNRERGTSASGMIDTLGGPAQSYYWEYMGNGNNYEKVPFSQDGYNAHLNNIRGLEFKEPTPLWKSIKSYLAPKWNTFVDKLKVKELNGGKLPYHNTLLRHINGF